MDNRRALHAGTAPTMTPSSAATPTPAPAICHDGVKAPGANCTAKALATGPHDRRQADSQYAAQGADQHGLAEHVPRYPVVAETQRLQHREFRDAFAQRLRHGVRGQQEHGEEHGGENARGHQPHVADLRGESPAELVLRTGLGRVSRVFEQGVDGCSHFRGPVGIGYPHRPPAHRPRAETASFVEERVVEQERVAITGHVAGVGSHEIEGPDPVAVLHRPDIRLDGDLLAELPTERLHEVRRYHPHRSASVRTPRVGRGRWRLRGTSRSTHGALPGT